MDPATHSPVVFLHIPKTAGTSLTHALLALRPWAHILTHDGNITPDMIDTCRSFSAEGQAGTFMHGHPLHGSLDALAGAMTMRVVRDPEQQTVSNYLHIRRGPATPPHHDANALPFDIFLQRHWPLLVFQNISIDVANPRSPIGSQDEFFKRLAPIHEVLARIDFVGTTDNLQAFIDRIADLGVPHAEIVALRAVYRALVADPVLQRLHAAEQALYDAARQRPIGVPHLPALLARLRHWAARQD